MKRAVEESQVIYIAVGTPHNHDGSASLKQIEEIAKKIASYINGYKVIVNKCTVPVGTAHKIKQIISGHCEPSSSVICHCEEPLSPLIARSHFPLSLRGA